MDGGKDPIFLIKNLISLTLEHTLQIRD